MFMTQNTIINSHEEIQLPGELSNWTGLNRTFAQEPKLYVWLSDLLSDVAICNICGANFTTNDRVDESTLWAKY